MSLAMTASRISDSSRNVWRTLRQKTRTRVDRVGETIPEAPGENLPNTAPPPYTELSSPGRSGDPLPNSTSRPTKHTHLSAVPPLCTGTCISIGTACTRGATRAFPPDADLLNRCVYHFDQEHDFGSPEADSSEAAAPYPLLTRIVKINSITIPNLLILFLLEIMAVTFSADFQRLRAAIAKSRHSRRSPKRGQSASSILIGYQKPMLKELCTLVRDLEEKLRRCRWPAARQHDKYLLVKFVLEPAQKLQIDAEYALEVIGRYRYFEACGVMKIETLVDHWMPSYPRIRPRRTRPMLDLGDTLASHASFIASLSSLRLAEVCLLLENAMATFQKDKGLEELRNSKELQKELLSSRKTCCWPLSDKYMNLAKALRTGAMDNHLVPARERLRKQRKYRLYF